MAIRSDTAGTEKRYLLDMLALGDVRILEIGCGDGRLTWQYADLAASVVGIDVATEALGAGLEGRPRRLAHQVDFLMASGMALPFKSASFDHALFAHSF